MRYLVALWMVLLWGTGAVMAREARNEVFTTATCANTSTTALAANAVRVSALLVNDSTQTIWIKVGEAAVANEGIRLNANGGSYYMAEAYNNRDTEVINCIVASGTGLLLVTEWSN